MGYGLNTTLYPTRRWGQIITWSGEDKGKLAEAMGAWHDATGVLFQRSMGSNTDFIVQWGQSMCCWSTKSPGNGRPDGSEVGQLKLKDDSQLGTLVHELGHLLGLSHEQDRPDHRDTFYAKAKFDWELGGAITRSVHNSTYGDFDPASVMLYPKSHYDALLGPSAGDAAAVKAINSWTTERAASSWKWCNIL